MCGCRKAASRSIDVATRAVPSAPVSAPRAVRAVPAPAPAPAPVRRAPMVRTAPAPRAAPAVAPTGPVTRSVLPRMGRARGPAPPPPEPTTRTGLKIYDTSVWGAKLWQVLHTVAAAADNAPVLTAWGAVPAALRVSLPCPECDGHFNAWCDSRPAPTDTAEAVRAWLLDLHNQVNARNGRPAWSADDLAAHYNATPETIAAAQAALRSLQGIIGIPAFVALSAALTA